jgi:hypothetical protein
MAIRSSSVFVVGVLYCYISVMLFKDKNPGKGLGVDADTVSKQVENNGNTFSLHVEGLFG